VTAPPPFHARSSTAPHPHSCPAASKIGAGTTEVILVVAIAANYFSYITINEPYYKYVILWLLAQTLGVPFLARDGTAKKHIHRFPPCASPSRTLVPPASLARDAGRQSGALRVLG